MKTIFSTLLLTCLMLQATAQIQWQHCYGGTNEDEYSVIRPTFDSGFILAGASWSNNGDVSGNHGQWDFWVVKITATGAIEWQKCYGGSGDDEASNILQAADSGYVVVGYSTSNDGDVSGNHGGKDVWIIKISSSGELKWQKCLGGSSNDEARTISKTHDGGYVVVGETNSNDGDVSGNHGGSDIWVISLTDTGSTVWAKCYGGTSTEYGASVQQTYEGGYIVGGSTSSNDDDVTGNHGGGDLWALKLSAIGSIEWEKSLGGSDWDFGNVIVQTSDSGYVVAGGAGSVDGDVTGHIGYCYSCGPQGLDAWVIKLSNSGAIQWNKCIATGGVESINALMQTTDGGFIIAGTTFVYMSNTRGALGKLSDTGSLDWMYTFGDSSHDTWLGSVAPVNDGVCIAAGTTAAIDGDVSGNHGSYDYWVVKFGEPNHVKNVEKENTFILTPNPVNQYLNVTATCKITSMTIGNILGQQVFSGKYETEKVTIDVSALPPGVYFIKVNGLETTRFVRG